MPGRAGPTSGPHQGWHCLDGTFFMASGYTAFMWIVGQTGTAELAAANVLLTVTLVAVLPGLAFGMVAASLVGQALGRGDLDDAEAWGWDVVRMGVLTLGLMGLPMLLVPEMLALVLPSLSPWSCAPSPPCVSSVPPSASMPWGWSY